jgi:hypothetical protein
MLKRYPHNGKIVVVFENDSNTGISSTKTEEFIIEGRFEPEASKSDNIDYKGKFYCESLDYLLKKFIEKGLFPDSLISNEESTKLIPFGIDGQTLIYNDKRFQIVMLHNYQTHCEIWLE